MGPQSEHGFRTFDITIYGDVAVDLQAARLPWMGEPLPPDRSVFSVGDLEGHVQGVLPGASNVVIRLVSRTLGAIQLRALSLDGTPLADAEVRLTSMADWIDAKTGADGRVVVQDVPVRPWEIQVKPPRTAWPHAVFGRTTGTPGSPEFDVALRRSVVVRVRTSTAPPAQTFLSFGDARAAAIHTIGWLPGPDGTMELAIDPDWLQVRVRVEQIVEQVETYWRSDILAQATVAVTPGTVIDIKLGP